VRGGVHARQATPAGAQGWGRDGVSWRRSRRSPARRHGWRRARRPWLVGANTTGCTARCSGRPRTRRSFLWRPCTRLTRPRRGHGGAAVLCTAASTASTAEARKRDQRPGLAFKATAHACWGARLRAPWPARERSRTRTRRGRDAGAPTRRGDNQTVVASYGKRGEARRVARTSTKVAAPAEDCNPAWLDGRHHQQRRGGAVARNVPPRLEGRDVHREKGGAVLTGGPRGPSGEGVGEEVRDAVTRKEAALVGEADGRHDEEEVKEAGVAGVRGSRGSGSSSRAAPASRRVVLLRAPPSSSFSSPSPSPPACE
jgi:hypothetical protein